MYVYRAYAERETLSDNELERLEQGLGYEIDRYRGVIRNSPADRLAIELPYLADMEAKLAEVRRLRAKTQGNSN